ncbi:MAG: hypothetical protein ACRC7W_05725 [Fusobacteriaceae bacterium]
MKRIILIGILMLSIISIAKEITRDANGKAIYVTTQEGGKEVKREYNSGKIVEIKNK